MKESSVAGEVLHVGVFLIVAAVVLLAGWNEPLRYLFMSAAQIAHEERLQFVPPAAEKPVASGLKGSALDRAPYRTLKDGTIEYSLDFDSRKPGTRTETEGKDNLYNRRR
jgi:hypothetical protein